MGESRTMRGELDVAVGRGSPFWAEGPIPPALLDPYFIDRSGLASRIASRWAQRAPARSVLLAPAWGGKRSLLATSLGGPHGPEVHVVRIRASRVLPGTERGLAEAILAALPRTAAVVRFQRELRYGPPETPRAVFGGLDGLLDRLPQRALFVVEDAEALVELPASALEALDAGLGACRAHAVALAGMIPNKLSRHMPVLFGSKGVRHTRLPPLSRDEAGAYLEARFRSARCNVRPEARDLLVEYAGGDPASLQLLGARCHDVLLRAGRGRLDEQDVVQGLYLALESLPPAWTRVLGAVTGRMRDVFVALAVLDDPTVAQIAERIHLDAKNVSVLAGRLIERGAPVEKVARGRYRITHRLLKEWVRKEWAIVAPH